MQWILNAEVRLIYAILVISVQGTDGENLGTLGENII